MASKQPAGDTTNAPVPGGESAPPAAVVKKAPVGLKTVALYEGAKGVIVLLAGLGALLLIHRDAAEIARNVVHALGLNPEHHYLRLLIEAGGRLTEQQERLLALVALFYSATRFVIAYGLWLGCRWAEWVTLIAACVYFPFELHHLYVRRELVSLIVPVLNVIVVVYLARLLAASRKRHRP